MNDNENQITIAQVGKELGGCINTLRRFGRLITISTLIFAFFCFVVLSVGDLLGVNLDNLLSFSIILILSIFLGYKLVYKIFPKWWKKINNL